MISQSTRTRLGEIEAKRAESARQTRHGYLSYIADYNASQKKILRDVTEKLTEDKVTDPLRIYEYAVESGLSADAAEAAYDSVYRSVKNQVKSEIIDKIFSRQYTAEMAEAYAKSVGLRDKDISEILNVAQKYQRSFEKYSDDYLAYLEALGSQNTVSHK